MTRPLVRLMLVDGHDAIRRGVRNLFEMNDRFRIVADVRDGAEALQLAEKLKPHVAIIDSILPTLNGIDLAGAMQRAGLCTRVLLYTSRDCPETVSHALDAGIRAFVLKSDPEGDLLTAVEALANGRPHMPSTISDILLDRFLESEPRTLGSALTQKERNVVQLIAEGDINKQVAYKLGVTVKTVETHRSSAMKKLKIHSTAELVRWAIRHNLVQP